MDKLPVNVVLQIDLTKNLEAYYWLKGLMQNPIYDDETYKELGFRKVIFDALNSVSLQRRESTKDRDLNTLPVFNADDDIPF